MRGTAAAAGSRGRAVGGAARGSRRRVRGVAAGAGRALPTRGNSNAGRRSQRFTAARATRFLDAGSSDCYSQRESPQGGRATSGPSGPCLCGTRKQANKRTKEQRQAQRKLKHWRQRWQRCVQIASTWVALRATLKIATSSSSPIILVPKVGQSRQHKFTGVTQKRSTDLGYDSTTDTTRRRAQPAHNACDDATRSVSVSTTQDNGKRQVGCSPHRVLRRR